MATQTPNYSFNLPDVGGDKATWGGYLNLNWQSIDTTLKGINDTTDGLGTISTQNADAVTITGGTINGTTVGATSKSTGTFTDVDADNITGAALVQSDRDATAGRVLTTGGWFGLGSDMGIPEPDFNNMSSNGFWACEDLSVSANAPAGWTAGPASVFVCGWNLNNQVQYAFRQNEPNDMQLRLKRAGVWQAWQPAYIGANVLNPVSQVGGNPTGGLIESSFGDTWSLRKYADGTFIQDDVAVMSYVNANECLANITFREAFAAPPICMLATPTIEGGVLGAASLADLGLTAFGPRTAGTTTLRMVTVAGAANGFVSGDQIRAHTTITGKWY